MPRSLEAPDATALVLEFALETASRRCEIVRLGPQHVKKGRIRVESKGSKDVDILLTPELKVAIDTMPKAQIEDAVNSSWDAVIDRSSRPSVCEMRRPSPIVGAVPAAWFEEERSPADGRGHTNSCRCPAPQAPAPIAVQPVGSQA
jgi:hypothetical protein